MKKVWKGAAAAIAALSLGVTGFVGATSAYAETVTTGSITITDDATTARAYNAYQIFEGEYDTETEALSNVEWGKGITAAGQAALITEVRTQVTEFNKTATTENRITLSDTPTAADVAKAIADLRLGANSAGAKALANVFKTAGTLSSTKTALAKDGDQYKAEGIATGYYLIEDSTNLGDNKHEAKTSFLLQVVGDAEATPKREVPTVTKEVEDEKNEGTGTEWGDSADHEIGEEFRFKLNANVPANANLADYATYKLVFNDSMSAGLTWNSIESVTVKPTGASSITIPAKTASAAGYELSDNAVADATGPLAWTLTIANIRDFLSAEQFVGGFDVTVTYKAQLNADAYVNDANGTTTNKNDVDLSFSNNPNVDTEMGKTPKDEVYVFTFKVNALKTKGDGTTALEGAGFTIYKGEKNDSNKMSFVWNATKNAYVVAPAGTQGAVTEVFSKADGNFSFQGLEEGTYIVSETTTPAGYNTAADTTVVIGANHSGNNVEFTQDTTTSITVINTPGSSLPETGGMGTTILYAAGAAIVLIAGIGLAVTLRRRQA
ncbi:cell surface protein [Bifidobacterium pseudolongum subsp. globosum]|uniref:Cell surface protein n=2 Tax=Bifidobacterium pseudolongum TaxID=1694 RepID=A0A223AB51_9BIFI|nr:isopeptide-forming domain-containing fimbrial protein [Bifidobacterium pseudolongum]ASS31185.1 cell surface protein [Bifidobacterium pseudolongum]PKU90132.1 cell surface protein [Bifidobacterium pseudolongum subsp. globosum]PKV05123.1 cell surface protein [Bifidobacterium pseudolongum subsp. globosum]